MGSLLVGCWLARSFVACSVRLLLLRRRMVGVVGAAECCVVLQAEDTNVFRLYVYRIGRGVSDGSVRAHVCSLKATELQACARQADKCWWWHGNGAAPRCVDVCVVGVADAAAVAHQ